MKKRYTLRTVSADEEEANRESTVLDSEARRLAGLVIARVVSLMGDLREGDDERRARARELIDRLYEASAAAASSPAKKKRLSTLLAATDNAMFLVRAVEFGALLLATARAEHGGQPLDDLSKGAIVQASFDSLRSQAPAPAQLLDVDLLWNAISAWESAGSTKKKSAEARKWPAMLALARSTNLCLNAEPDSYRKAYTRWSVKHP